jgi:membrane protease YdiL (CAAX protease family)
VQSEKQWDLEAVLLLGAGLMVSLSAGALANLALLRLFSDLTVSQQKFYGFLIGSVSLQVVGLTLIHFFLRQHALSWMEFLGLKRPGLGRAIALGVAVVVVALPLTLGLNKACEILLTQLAGKAEAQPSMKILEISISLPQRLYFAFTAIVLAPLLEEILFRAILYRGIKQRGHPRLALFGSALLFATIHLSLLTFVPLAVLAIILALLYDKADNLMAPIVAHSLFNAANFILYLYQNEATRWWHDIFGTLQPF